MEIMQTIHLRWQRGMYRERTFTVKLADGFTHIFLKDMNRGQDGQTLQEYVCYTRCGVNLKRHMGRSVEGWFHESWNSVPCFLLQSRWRSQRFVPR